MEVISDDDPGRDLQTKRLEYAEANIPEYWIVDPRAKSITVLKLEGNRYVTHDQAQTGGVVSSQLLGGFCAEVKSVFDAANPR
jgi:Uma2 family endonuclease